MLENKLAQYTSGFRFELISTEGQHIIKRNILDSYAGICASLSDWGMLEKFDTLAAMVPAVEGMEVWGIGKQANPGNALFMNCILGRRSDLVNTYLSPNNTSGSHPSDNISLCLSLSDLWKKSGKDFLTSAYLSYLFSCAFADYYDPQANGFDHDAQALMYIPLVIGYLKGLDKGKLRESLRIAGMMGLTTDQSGKGAVSDWRHCTYASAAQRSMEATLLAEAGFTGATDIYEGEAGINRFFPHSPKLMDPMPDLASIVFKRWPALVFCQTPIDVAIEAGEKIEDIRQIDKIEIHTYKKAIEVGGIPNSYKPDCRAARTHSIPYCVAMALGKKSIRYEHFNEGFIDNEEDIESLIHRVEMIEDKQMNACYPKGSPCRIIIYMKDGREISLQKDFPHGDPADPLSDREIEDKAREYLGTLLNKQETDNHIERIWKLDEEKSVDWLINPLKKRIIP